MLIYSKTDAPPTQGCKVVICDDHPQMRGGLRNVLVDLLRCDVIGEVASGEKALELMERDCPDMIVLDLQLAGRLTGQQVLHEIHARHLPVKAFVHTAFLNREQFEEWVNSPDGPDGVDEKGTGDLELAIGFTQVLLTSDKYVPLRLIKKFGSHLRGEALDRLTPKELQVLKLALRPELTTQEIAKQLSYSASTVRSYLTMIYAKLGLEQHTRAGLVAFYYGHQDEHHLPT